MTCVILNLDSKDSKVIDPSLLISREEIFSCCSSSTKANTVTQKNDGSTIDDAANEQQNML